MSRLLTVRVDYMPTQLILCLFSPMYSPIQPTVLVLVRIPYIEGCSLEILTILNFSGRRMTTKRYQYSLACSHKNCNFQLTLKYENLPVKGHMSISIHFISEHRHGLVDYQTPYCSLHSLYSLHSLQ